MRPNAEDINDRMKLLMHRVIAYKIRHEPEVIDRARVVLQQMVANGYDEYFTRYWSNLLDQPISVICHEIGLQSEKMTSLRCASPLPVASGYFTDEQVRRRMFRKSKKSLKQPLTEEAAYAFAA
jgi:hypothetical protein